MTESQDGYTGSESIAMVVTPRSLEEGTTIENVADHQRTGEDLNTTEDDTVQRSKDSRNSWLIVVVVTVVLVCSSLQTTLQLTTLSRFGQTTIESSFFEQSKANESSFFGQTTNESSFFRQTKTNESSFFGQTTNVSSFFGQTKTNETTFFEQTKANASSTQAYVPIPSTSVTDSVVTTQTILFSVFGVVSATLILVIGYRLVTLAGGVLLGVGCLGAAYCNNCSIHLVVFLYGALPGMGQAMISVSTTVAILEHFEKRRLTALLIPLLGVYFTTMPVKVPNISIIEGKINTWKGYLLLQAVGAGVVIPLSLALKPLKQRKMDDNNSSFVARIFRIEELKIYRNPTLYTFTLVWFLWEGGCTILQYKLPTFQGRWIIPGLPLWMVLVVTFALLPVIGTCISCCIPSTVSLRRIVFLLSVFCVIAGFLNLLASQLYDYIYAIAFYGLLGVLKGVASPVLELAIPLLLGEEHVEMGTGFCVMGQGLGGVTMALAAGEIEKITKKVGGCFYLAGALFLCGFVFMIVTYLPIRSANKIETTKPQQNPDP